MKRAQLSDLTKGAHVYVRRPGPLGTPELEPAIVTSGRVVYRDPEGLGVLSVPHVHVRVYGFGSWFQLSHIYSNAANTTAARGGGVSGLGGFDSHPGLLW